jgi:hypothetical protein
LYPGSHVAFAFKEGEVMGMPSNAKSMPRQNDWGEAPRKRKYFPGGKFIFPAAILIILALLVSGGETTASGGSVNDYMPFEAVPAQIKLKNGTVIDTECWKGYRIFNTVAVKNMGNLSIVVPETSYILDAACK